MWPSSPHSWHTTGRCSLGLCGGAARSNSWPVSERAERVNSASASACFCFFAGTSSISGSPSIPLALHPCALHLAVFVNSYSMRLSACMGEHALLVTGDGAALLGCVEAPCGCMKHQPSASSQVVTCRSTSRLHAIAAHGITQQNNSRIQVSELPPTARALGARKIRYFASVCSVASGRAFCSDSGSAALPGRNSPIMVFTFSGNACALRLYFWVISSSFVGRS